MSMNEHTARRRSRAHLAIVTVWRWICRQNNFGSLFQAYALQETLRELGAQPELLRIADPKDEAFRERLRAPWVYRLKAALCVHHRRRESLRWRALCAEHPQGFMAFAKRRLLLSRNAVPVSNLPEIRGYDGVVVGSDQVWELSPTEGFLTFAGNVRRVAYAASRRWRDPSAVFAAFYRQMAPRFSAIGIREREGVEICRALGVGPEPQWVADPTLLLGADRWLALAKAEQGMPRGEVGLLAYCVGEQPKATVEALRTFGSELHVVGCQRAELAFAAHELLWPTPGEWLGLMAQAEGVCTNSFHGICFALQFHRPFVCIRCPDARIASLLEVVGLSDRWAEEAAGMRRVLECPIDWADVDRRLRAFAERSRVFLRKALDLPESLGKQAPIAVACASDHAYFCGLLVTLHSLCSYASPSVPLRLHVFDAGLTSEDRAVLEAFPERFPGRSIDMRLHAVDATTYGAFPAWRGNHVAYVRLMLQESLADEAFVIYTDVDTLWLRDVAELWEQRSEGHLLWAVPDGSGLRHYSSGQARAIAFSALGYEIAPEDYFCSGLLMMNLRRLREEGFTARCAEALQRFGERLAFPDQDLYNLLCPPPETCLLDPMWGEFSAAYGLRGTEAARVIHYANAAPWRRKRPTAANTLWWDWLADRVGFEALGDAAPRFRRLYARQRRALRGVRMEGIADVVRSHMGWKARSERVPESRAAGIYVFPESVRVSLGRAWGVGLPKRLVRPFGAPIVLESGCDLSRAGCCVAPVEMGWGSVSESPLCRVRVGRWAKVGAGVSCVGSVASAPVYVGHGAEVGAGATLAYGIKVGEGAHILPGAVVSDDVPPYAVVGGSPARVVRQRAPSHVTEALSALRWWCYDLAPLGGRILLEDPVAALSALRGSLARKDLPFLAPEAVTEDLLEPYREGRRHWVSFRNGSRALCLFGHWWLASPRPFHTRPGNRVPPMEPPAPEATVSIVMPAHDCSDCVEEQLNAISGQTFSRFECIGVDDGSTDATGMILDEHVRKDARFRVVHTPPMGVVAARNRGLDRARGQWLNMCDADDRVHSRWLEAMVWCGETFATDVASVRFTDWTEGFALPPPEAPAPKTWREHVRVARTPKAILALPMQQPAVVVKLFRRSLVGHLRYPGGAAMSEDVRFWACALSVVRSCASLDLPLYDYRRRPGSLSHRESVDLRTFRALTSRQELAAALLRNVACMAPRYGRMIARWLGGRWNSVLKNALHDENLRKEGAQMLLGAISAANYVVPIQGLPLRQIFARRRLMRRLRKLAGRGGR